MGLLDQLKGGVESMLSGSGGSNSLFDSLSGLITNPQVGGLSGLVQKFKEKGLGDIVSSWIGTGENLPVSGEQLRGVLGEEIIQKLANQAGTSQAEASKGLAEILPKLVDNLTPGGKLPTEGFLAQGLDSLKKFFS